MKDGTILDRYTAPMIGGDGKYYGRMWTFRDITKRKQAEAALIEQLALRERLAKIAANVPGIIYSFRLRPDGSTCLPYVSPTIEEFYGVRAEDLVDDASQFLDLIHPDDQARTWESIAESSRTLLPWRAEFRFRHSKRGVFWVEGQSTPERKADGSTLWHGFMSDITARKQLNESLRESEEKFRQLADNISDVFWISSPDLKAIHYVSPAYARIWGRSTESLHANSHQWVESVLPEQREHVFAEFARLKGNEPEVSIEYQIARPDGTLRWIHDRGFQVRDAAGKLIRLAGIASDVTERKRIAKEVIEHKENEERSRRELKHERELNQIKSQFVSMVSHEFRTPLCVINTAASLLEDYSAKMTGEERTEHTQQIEHAVDRMAQMMEDLLVHEKLQTGKMECTPALVDMEAFCRELILEITKQPGAAHLIECAIHPVAREAFLDKRILRHILCNLLTNAVKYSQDHQPVTLEVKRVAGRAQTGSDMNTLPGDHIQLLVRDSGIGIPVTDLAKLFQTFHRAGNVGNRPGTGMGLAIVKKFVDLHRGTIRVESTEGKGTSVWVCLPIDSNESPGRPSPLALENANAETAKPGSEN